MKLRQFIMDRVAQLRLMLSPGTKLELWLAEKHTKLLNKQMDERRKAGIQEIQCRVEWYVGGPND